MIEKTRDGPLWVLPSSFWGQRRSTSTLGSVTCGPTWGGVATAQGTGGAAGLRDKSPRATVRPWSQLKE